MQSEEQTVDNSAAKNQQHGKKVSQKRNIGNVKKLDMETAKLLHQFKEKVNKKNFGRKVTDVEILAKAVRLLEPQHIAELQEVTYSQQDRLEMAYEDYVKSNGKATFDQFLGKLLTDLSLTVKKS